MAIILCPECEGKVSNLATTCPHCGYPLLTFHTGNTEVKQTEISYAIMNAKVGDKIKLGTYPPQDQPFSQPILWTVIESIGKFRLLISSECIEYMQCSKRATEKEWELCHLRNWLNNEFFTGAFSESEQNLVKNIMYVDRALDKYSADDKIPLDDKVFVLSNKEAEEYSVDTACGTRLVFEKAYEDSKTWKVLSPSLLLEEGLNYQFHWWTRDYCNEQYGTAGFLILRGMTGSKVLRKCGVRPCMWIQLP